MTWLTSNNLAVALLGAWHCHMSRHKTIIAQSSTIQNLFAHQLTFLWIAGSVTANDSLYTMGTSHSTCSVQVQCCPRVSWVSSTFRGSSLCRESRTNVLLSWFSLSSFGTSANSIVLVVIRMDVPKHWGVGDSSPCFDKFCNISDSIGGLCSSQLMYTFSSPSAFANSVSSS